MIKIGFDTQLNGSTNQNNHPFFIAEFIAPLTHSLVAFRGSGSQTITRATTHTVQNNDGYLVTLASGEIGFPGARRVRNLLTFTEDFSNAAWLKSSAGAGSVPVVTSDQEANPIAGVAYADKIVFAAPGAGDLSMLQQYFTGATGSAYVGSFYVKAFAAGDIGKVILFRHAAGGSYTQVTLTAAYQRLSIKETGIGAVAFDIGLRPTFSSSSGTVSVYLTAAQLEDVTAQTTQTAGEYVSVGVLSSPWHGAGVDGVKWFSTDISGNPIPTSRTYSAVSLNGVAGTYVSTPDSVANSITGDIDVRVKAALTNWQATDLAFCGKRNVANSYQFTTGAAGAIKLFWWEGTVLRSAAATQANTFTANQTKWVRATLDVNNGASGCTVTFYTSDDGETWTPFGSAVTQAFTTSIDDTASQLWVGAEGTGGYLSAKIYRAQIYNGINGTLAVDFDASRYNPTASSTTLTGSTGETWTLQGNAVIHPATMALDGAEVWPAATNLCLQSNAFSTTWSQAGTPSPTQNVTGPDGTTSAWTLTDNNVGLAEAIYQDITLTATTYTFSVFVKKTTGAQASYPILACYPGVSAIAICTVDTTNGVATVFSSYTGFTIASGLTARCDSFDANFWRVSMSFTGTAAAWTTVVYLAGTTNPTQSTGTVDAAAQGSVVIYGAQVELGSYATPYIATTTAAVTRNASVVSVPTAGNIASAAGCIALEYTPQHAPSGTVYLWGTYVDANNSTAILHDATNLIFRKRIAGVNYDATIANAFVSGTTYKTCVSFGTSGTRIALNGTLGTPHANTTAAQIGTTMQTGADGNGASQPGVAIKNVYIGQRELSTSDLTAMTQ